MPAASVSDSYDRNVAISHSSNRIILPYALGPAGARVFSSSPSPFPNSTTFSSNGVQFQQ